MLDFLFFLSLIKSLIDCFFFSSRRRHTRCGRDWSSDVCSSDLKGEALVSFLEGGGTPAMVERVMIRPPTGRIGPITPEERKAIMSNSPVKGKYETSVDAESAYEMLQKRIAGTAAHPEHADAGGSGGGILGQIGG